MNTNFSPETIDTTTTQKRYVSRKRNDFNDLRLENTYDYYINNLVKSGATSILQSTQSDSEATRIYRFLKNKKVTMSELISKSCTISETNVSGRHLLVVGDSSIFNLNKHKNRITDIEKLGVIQDGKTKGFYSHVSMVLCPKTSTIIGLSDILYWNQSSIKSTRNSRTTALENKYSYKWHLGVSNSKKSLKSASSLTYVFDREADSFELFYHIQEVEKENFVIRQSRNRLVKKGEIKLKVLDLLKEDGENLGHYELEIDAKNRSHWRDRKNPKNRVKRTANMEVRIVRDVELLPTRSSKEGLQSIKLHLLEVKEIDNQKGNEEAIQWRLWTNHPINNLEEALEIVAYYLSRWNIEELFRTVKKKGFNQEATQLETTQAIMKQSVMTLLAACKIMQLVKARGNNQSQPIEEVFDNDEIKVLKKLDKKLNGKTEKLKNHNSPKQLSWASWIIARLGGWKGYESRKPPGPITMKRGYDKFCIYMEAYHDLYLE
ncbi:MAG: IS4 family transposase [Saprospiraceae bacterium]